MHARGGAGRRAPSSTSGTWSARRRRARAALDRLPARLPAQRPLLRLLHGQRRQHPRRRIPAPRRDARCARLTAHRDRDPAPGQRQPQRRPAPVPRRTCSISAPATAAPAATRPTTPRARSSLLGKLLRIDPRPSGGQALLGPGRQPLRGQAGPRRDLQLRPAQPLPLLLRHGDGAGAAADRDRRRRPEPLRGARLHDRRRRRRRQLRLGRLRGLHSLHRRQTATPPTPAARSSRSWPTVAAATAAAARSSAATSSRDRRPALAARSLRLRRPTAPASCAASSPTCAAPAMTGASASPSTPPPASAKTAADASTWPLSKGPSTGSYRAEHPLDPHAMLRPNAGVLLEHKRDLGHCRGSVRPTFRGGLRQR